MWTRGKSRTHLKHMEGGGGGRDRDGKIKEQREREENSRDKHDQTN